MKKFLIKTLLITLPILTIVITINIYSKHQDCNGLVEQKMVNTIKSGYNVTNLSKYNDRMFQKLMIEQMDTLPEQIVLGSSRAMQITHNYKSYEHFYNSAVFGGYLEDMLALYAIYEANQAPLKNIIIGIDPWIFKGDENKAGGTLYDRYDYMCSVLQIEIPNKVSHKISILTDYLSLSNIWPTIQTMVSNKNKLFTPTMDSLCIGETEYIDGSYSVTKDEREASRSELTHIDISHHINKNFIQLNLKEIEIFEKFTLHLQNKGLNITFVFAPIHPVVWQKVLIDDKMVIATEKLVKDFATKHQMEVMGTFDPTIYGFDVMDFINGGHPKRQVFDSIIIWNGSVN